MLFSTYKRRRRELRMRKRKSDKRSIDFDQTTCLLLFNNECMKRERQKKNNNSSKFYLFLFFSIRNQQMKRLINARLNVIILISFGIWLHGDQHNRTSACFIPNSKFSNKSGRNSSRSIFIKINEQVLLLLLLLEHKNSDLSDQIY